MDEIALLRRAIALSAESRAAGNHPFGALLADAEGRVLMEAGNGFHPHGDGTAHAERLLATRACVELPPEARASATLFSSAEPCAMCAGAIYWAGIGRVVFGLSERRLKALIGPHPENLTMDLPCREVFAAGQRAIAVEGPLLEDEAEAPHRGFW
jgi:tRNA(Arg) A34 adenosine deaminase TadA